MNHDCRKQSGETSPRDPNASWQLNIGASGNRTLAPAQSVSPEPFWCTGYGNTRNITCSWSQVLLFFHPRETRTLDFGLEFLLSPHSVRVTVNLLHWLWPMDQHSDDFLGGIFSWTCSGDINQIKASTAPGTLVSTLAMNEKPPLRFAKNTSDYAKIIQNPLSPNFGTWMDMGGSQNEGSPTWMVYDGTSYWHGWWRYLHMSI